MNLKLALLAAALASTVTPASAAVTVVSGGPSSFTVDYDGNVASTPVAGLSAQILFNYLNTTNAGKTYNFSYTLLLGFGIVGGAVRRRRSYAIA
jgi:hypothetical protein